MDQEENAAVVNNATAGNATAGNATAGNATAGNATAGNAANAANAVTTGNATAATATPININSGLVNFWTKNKPSRFNRLSMKAANRKKVANYNSAKKKLRNLLVQKAEQLTKTKTGGSKRSTRKSRKQKQRKTRRH